jgi:hypothetical protein
MIPRCCNFIVVLFVLCAYACTRDVPVEPAKPPPYECVPEKTAKVPDDLKDRFYFKTGTYWIYQNLATGETDSVAVCDAPFTVWRITPLESEPWDKCYETFSMYLVNRQFTHRNNYYMRAGLYYHIKNGYDLPDEFFSIQVNTLVMDDVGRDRISYQTGEYKNFYGATVNRLTVYELQTTSTNFYDVLRISYPGPTLADYFFDMYYAENFGLIKYRSSDDGSSWEMIRCHIVQ